MVTFDDFLAANPSNDLVVQKALADMDMDVLATALVEQKLRAHLAPGAPQG